MEIRDADNQATLLLSLVAAQQSRLQSRPGFALKTCQSTLCWPKWHSVRCVNFLKFLTFETLESGFEVLTVLTVLTLASDTR